MERRLADHSAATGRAPDPQARLITLGVDIFDNLDLDRVAEKRRNG